MISRSARRAAISTWCKSSSMPTQPRLRRRLATAVVPLPRNGSSTRSPSFVEANRQRSTRATGFCVGCFPWVFSSLPGADMVQTLESEDGGLRIEDGDAPGEDGEWRMEDGVFV